MTARPRQPKAAEGISPGALLEGAAFACILAVMVARVFVAEMPFRRAELTFTTGSREELKRPMEELTRVTFDVILLGAVSLWALGQVARRRFRMGAPVMAVLVLAFAAVSFPSALGAVDRRGAWEGWMEQLAVLLSAVVMIQLARDRRRWGLVVVVLAAVGVAMGARSVHQLVWENPRRLARFRANPERVLRQMDIVPDSPKARRYEQDLRGGRVSGHLGLVNVFASLLVMLGAAAAGLAVEKVAAARRPERSGPDPPGGTRLPMAAAIAGVVLTAGCLATLALTHSRGAIGATALAVAAAAAILGRPAFFARHRRQLLIAAGVALVVGTVALWACGSAMGELPGKSMDSRWHCWVGSARIVRGSPLRGVGLYNFGDAYLQRRPVTAVATKTAHNAWLDVACAFGLPATAVYIAILVYLALLVTRQATDESPRADPRRGAGGMGGWCVFLTAVVFIIRMAWAEPSRASVTLREAILPAAIFAASLLAMSWAGRNLGAAGLCGAPARTFLVAGLAGFLLHNLVTYTLITPVTSTVFWIAAGAVAAPAVRPRELPGARGLAIAAAAVIVAGTVAAGAWAWRPVRAKSSYLRSANFAYARGQLAPAVADMEAAIDADKLDAIPASYLSRIFMSGAQHAEVAKRDTYAAEAVRFAELAYQRNPGPLYAVLLAQALDLRAETRPRALEMAATSVRLNPTDTEYRQEYGEMLYRAGRLDAAAEQALQMWQIHDARPPGSNLRLSEKKLEALLELEERIEAARESQSASTRPAASRPEAKP